MRHHASWIIWIAIAAAIILVLLPLKAHGQPVILSVETPHGNDTLYVGEKAYLSFEVNTQGTPINGLLFPLEISFGSGSLMGAMPGDVSLERAPAFEPGFQIPEAIDSLKGTDPDTLRIGLVVSTPAFWSSVSPDWVARLHFQPKGTGQINMDSILVPPASTLGVFDQDAQRLPLEWHAPTFTVVPCPTLQGDVNQSGMVTSGDIIQLVSRVFLCGPGPFDILRIGDVDCNGVTTVSDVILLVNYVFKGVPLPFCCNVLH
jgi:hypothetical protein